MQVKQFDVAVSWLGRDRSRALKAFNGQPQEMEDVHDASPLRRTKSQQQLERERQQALQADGAARLAALRKAVGGGSMSPEALRLLMPYILVRAPVRSCVSLHVHWACMGERAVCA